MVSLARAFFERPPDEVARDLIGAHMLVRHADQLTTVRIVETEAYGGEDDPASHARRGPTARNAAMFGPAGHLYVYLIYGMHWCMNVVTQESGVASAVLLRGAEPVGPPGVVDRAATGADVSPRALRGPGNLTKALGVTGADDGRDCCAPLARISFLASGAVALDATRRSRRVGISRARERLSRYYLDGSTGVSRGPLGSPIR